MATNSPELIQQHQHYIPMGLQMKLPSTAMELATAKRQYFMHKGLHLVESSIEIGRAMNEAIIFTFGQSGAGKSTTLNHLFDMDLASVSSESACTRDVVYYVSSMSSTDWEVSNLKISFVDVPGWGDGRGVYTQAVNMATIEKFIAEHPHLGRGAPKCYPNIIMITVSATDNRPNDIASPAVLMLKAIRKLRIIDKRRHNVVIVMTHALSISIKNIKIKQELYQSLCRKEFGFEPPFVYVENNLEDQNPPLKEVGDWTVLPDDDGTKQPLNIFLSLIKQMTTYEDEVGNEAVSLFFKSRKESQPVEEGRVTSANVSDKAIQKWRNLIARGSLVGNRLSEVTQMIEHYVAANPNLPSCKKELVRPLISELLDSPFHNAEDFANLNITQVQYRLESYVLQDFEMALIIDLFKVEPMLFPALYDPILHTCLIDNDEIKIIPEQHIDVPNTLHISQGLEIPSFLKVNKFHNSEKRIIEFSTNISTETGIITALSDEGQAIHPVEHKEFELTFFIKEIVYTIYFDFRHPRDVKLKQNIQKSINNLPPKFQDAQVDQSIYEEYKNFFGHYGHFIIVKTSCGGWIEGKIKLKLEESRYNVAQPILRNCIQTILSNSSRNDEYLNKDFLQDYRDIIEEFYNTKIKFFGGRTPYLCETMGLLNSRLHDNWVESLYSIPLVLDPVNIENMTKLPNLIEYYERVKGTELNRALTDIKNDLKVSVSFPSIKNSSFLFGLSENRDRVDSFGNRSLDESGQIEDFIRSIAVNPNPNNLSYGQAGEPIEPIPPPTPTTRVAAANRASTNTHKRAIVGYPGSSVVLKSTGDRNRVEEVTLNNLQQQIQEAGENPVNAVCFCPIRNRFTSSPIEINPGNNEREHQYIVIKFEEGNIAVGFKQLIMRYKLNDKVKEGFVKAISLRIGDYICILNRLEERIKFTQITNISLEQHVGCFYPSTKSTYLVVDLVITKPKENCFPGNASVVLKGGERGRMDELKIGDYVLSIHPTTGKPVYSRVYLWAHRDPHITATFLHITHPHGHLHISANHLILSGDKRRPVPADQLQVGDSVHFLSPCLSQQQQQQQQQQEEERRDSHTLISVPVLHIQTCTQVGYYAPFTNNGLIVVDGIAASVYSHISTHSQSDSSSSSRSWLWSGVCHSVTSGLVHQFGMHRVGQCVLTPVRVGCELGAGSVLSQQMDTNTHIHKYCQWLLKICGTYNSKILPISF